MNHLYFNNTVEHLLSVLTDGLYNNRGTLATSGLPFSIFNPNHPLFKKVVKGLCEAYAQAQGNLTKEDIMLVLNKHKINKVFGYNKENNDGTKTFHKFDQEEALHWNAFFQELEKVNTLGEDKIPFEAFDEKRFDKELLPLYEKHFNPKNLVWVEFKRGNAVFHASFDLFRKTAQEHSNLSMKDIVMLSTNKKAMLNSDIKIDVPINFSNFAGLEEGWQRFKVATIKHHEDKNETKKARKVLKVC